MEVLPSQYKQLVYRSPFNNNERQLDVVFWQELNMAVPLTKDRKVLTEEQWAKVRGMIDNFYKHYEGKITMKSLNDALLADQDLYRKKYGKVMESTRTSTQKSLSGYVYILHAPGYPEFGYKIGYTSNVFSRLKHYNIATPFKVEVLFAIYSNDCGNLEKDLHERFKEKRTCAEWFKLSEFDITWIKLHYNCVEVPRE